MVLEALELQKLLGRSHADVEVNPMLKQYKTDTFRYVDFGRVIRLFYQMVWVSGSLCEEENCYPVTQKELENGIYNGEKSILSGTRIFLESGKENRKYI